MSIPQKSFPFDLPIEGGFLHCQKLLHAVPGKRLIIVGLWQQKPVLAKIFLTPLDGWLQFNRELRGTQALLAAHISTPSIVHASYLKKFAAFIILFELLPNAVEFNERFQFSTLLLERPALLRQLVQTLAKQHKAGILQTDLSLKNFLFAHNSLYTINTSSIRVQKRNCSPASFSPSLRAQDAQSNPEKGLFFPGLLRILLATTALWGRVVTQKPLLFIQKSLSSFALLLAQLDLTEEKLKDEVISWYFQLRGWTLEPHLLNYLNKQEVYWQKKREKGLKSQLFCPSTRFAAEKTAQRFWVCDRQYLTEELSTLLKSPEYLFSTQNMKIIKDDSTTTVGVIQISNRHFLVKRYNLKHFWHRLKRLVSKTRAKKSWGNAHRLLFRGIRTPQPIAMIENRWGIFRGVCYFICEYIPGITATEYFKPHQLDLTQGYATAQQILKILQDLTTKKICHGDLKASNILLNEKGIWLIDLDAVRFYQNHFYFKKRIQKDRERFMRNWQGQSMISDLFKS